MGNEPGRYQDYRPSVAVKEALRPPKLAWRDRPFKEQAGPIAYVIAFLACIAALVAFWLGGAFSSDGSDAPAKPRASSQEICSAAWEENKNNAYNAIRTKAEYMRNCVEVQDELQEIRRDHR